AVTHLGAVDNTKLISYLHTHTIQTVQGAATFNMKGENLDAQHQAFIFQWQNSQFLQVLPATRSGPAVLALKPSWG
ncbi:MAG TPA: hypothetical protein VN327_00755, partial [Pseudonocardiaceae bacterium]|nr:hypothetical protein [Pseudonocardiaceae bacterium]